jgi:hypothetical protein
VHSGSNWRALGLRIALSLLAFSCFVPSLSGAFVYDDDWTIVHNSAIRSFDRVPDLFNGRAVDQRVPDAWRPLMVMLHMVDYRLFGLRPLGYHLHNVMWHVACVLIAFAFVRRIGARTELALLAAALFAVHPLVVEPVSAINFREDLLATFFGLASLCVLLGRPEDRRPARSAPGPGAILGGAALLGCGLLAKGTAAAFPLLYPGLVLAMTAGSKPVINRLRALLPPAAALAATVAVFLAWRLATAGAINPYPHLGVTFAGREAGSVAAVLTQGEAFLRTTGQMLFPVGLSPEYDQSYLRTVAPLGVAGVALLLGLVGASYLLARRGAVAPACGALLLALGWIPTAGLLPLPNLRADRYAYLPLLGLCLLGAALLQRVPRRAVRATVAAAALLACGVLSVNQQQVWRSELALWSHASRIAPRSARVWSGLARAEAGRGRLAEAERHARRGVSLAPESGEQRLVLGNILARRRRFGAALREYRAAKRLGSRHPAHLYTSWGWVAHLAGRNEDALRLLGEAVVHDPGLALAHSLVPLSSCTTAPPGSVVSDSRPFSTTRVGVTSITCSLQTTTLLS